MMDIFSQLPEETVQLEDTDGTVLHGIKALFSGDTQVTIGSVEVAIRAGQRLLRPVGGDRIRRYRIREARRVEAYGPFPAHYQLTVEIDITVPSARKQPAGV